MIVNEMQKKIYEEKNMKTASGGMAIFLSILAYAAAIFGMVWSIIRLDGGENEALWVTVLVITSLYICAGWIFWLGIKIVKPNEAMVITLFGKYKGTIKKEGLFYINPFCTAINPTAASPIISGSAIMLAQPAKTDAPTGTVGSNSEPYSKKISLKAMTLVNKKQKINDEMGNPIEVGIVVIWRVINTAKAVFNVDNYKEYISTQADSALRDVVRKYPYDISGGGDEASLRGSSQTVAADLKNELQNRVEIAGLEITEARITHLAYAPEIAAAMLQRQQASAIIEARQKIVDGAVGMVEMALNKLNENNICELDEERKAAMVSNLLVVLCGNKDAQPIVNSGSIY